MNELIQRAFTVDNMIPNVSTNERGDLLLIYTKGEKHLSIVVDDEDLTEPATYFEIRQYVKYWEAE